MTITYHVGNIIRGTTADRTGGTWTNLPAGWLFIESNGLAIYRWNATTWDLIGAGALASLTGTLAVGRGGTGATTLTGILKGNGASAITAGATVTVAEGGTGATTLTGVLKGNGTSAITAAAQLAIADGGTGAATATAAFDALSPMTTAGDIIYGGASGTRTRLATGTANQLLRVNSGATAPEWASTLSGLTLTTPIINGVKGGDVAITSADSPYTALATTRIIRADATSGAITINLPTAVGIAGFTYKIYRTDIVASTNIITVDANSTETIDGSLTYRIYPAEWIHLESDGANWQVIARPNPNLYGYYVRRAVTNIGWIAGFSSSTATALLTSTTSPAANLLWALPIIVARTTKFDKIQFRTRTASTLGHSRAGIYYDNGNCYPGVLMFDTGSIDTTVTPAIMETTITAGLQVFQPGLYWLAYEQDTATGQIDILSTNTNVINVMGVSMSTSTHAWHYNVAHTYGALPDPYTAAATASNVSSAVGTPIPAILLHPL